MSFLPEFDNPLDFTPPAEVIESLVHSTLAYHVVVGLDPIGSFHAVRGLQLDNPVFSYEELGRNTHPVQLPFNGPRKGGEVTLEWGTIVRSRFWNWFHAQSAYLAEPQPVFIIHLSRRRLPLRIFVLWGAWPSGWEYSDLGGQEVAVERVRLTYDRMFLLNPGILMLGKELGLGVVAAPTDTEDPWVWEKLDDPPLKRPEIPPAPDGSEPWFWEALPEDRFPKRGKWKKEKQKDKPYEAVAAEWMNEKLEQDLEQESAEWANTALPEEYVGVPGVWFTEALPEEYVGSPSLWDPLLTHAAKIADAAGKGGKAGGDDAGGSGGGADDGDGKSVDDEEA